ncbi:MAG: DUF4126 domain-containing protein [Actinobacteria bacterium]|jgi:hypothetical protein|nr:DUF4126 domain-containing protein [Acidimicrobiaceae bacterium]MBP6487368.1 DUF4126 domain-containing protein [Ilumatobacteraceae bacterium]NMD24520.1 DUF4126 domain-containing protein [Actinomycetota bacterium]MBP7887714.1 DUF4126 domain-containing protein [Ilumatobacteraceae bacterium]MBP8209241.1 DUF4126 domain-containing protein [Ilumatobacteraceae bacterium]
MESIALVAAGWASGLNAYLTLLILGVAGRAGWAETPHDLQQTWVLAAAGVAFVIEFVIDKVPILDSLWDLGHTFIRPVVGGLTGAAIAGAQLGRPAAFALAAGLALIGHLTKTTSRLAINMSPEPLTNILASVAEDGLVAVLVALAMAYPKTATVIAVLAAVIGVLVAILLWKFAKRGLRRVRGWLQQRRPATS